MVIDGTLVFQKVGLPIIAEDLTLLAKERDHLVRCLWIDPSGNPCTRLFEDFF